MPHPELIRLDPLPASSAPPDSLGRFVAYFIRPIRGFVLAMFVAESVAGGLQAAIPVLLGWLVNDISAAGSPAEVLARPWLYWLAIPTLIAWTGSSVATWYLYDHHFTPRFGHAIRHHLGRYTMGQSLAYFSGDFAGRIASKVLEGGPALRDPVRSSMGAVWYCGVFCVTSLACMAAASPWLAAPAVAWLAFYMWSLRTYVPRIRARGVVMANEYTTLTGHVNDTYANILSVKLFARERHEDEVRLAYLTRHSDTVRDMQHEMFVLGALQACANLALMIATPAVALLLWSHGIVGPGAIVMALPMCWQLNNQSGWIRNEVTHIAENLSRVEECIQTISKPYTVTDAPKAVPLQVAPGRGEVRFEGVGFRYADKLVGRRNVIDGLDLVIPAGQRVGLVGRSGAGKSTLVNLLLRFYDVEAGRILVDGQDVAGVTQESLRRHVGVVTQDNSLLHRSVADNVRYGRPGATDAEVIAACRRAHAHDFILGLSDPAGRVGYEAHVGERGVKLSGGQRQRIAIARIFLKDAPVLVLDEATSALDSEVEAAIQEEMAALMRGKTTIAIAHRLSTIAQMDRLLVLDRGRIVEDGSHAELLALGGMYAGLWDRQSGGFIAEG